MDRPDTPPVITGIEAVFGMTEPLTVMDAGTRSLVNALCEIESVNAGLEITWPLDVIDSGTVPSLTTAEPDGCVSEPLLNGAVSLAIPDTGTVWPSDKTVEATGVGVPVWRALVRALYKLFSEEVKEALEAPLPEVGLFGISEKSVGSEPAGPLDPSLFPVPVAGRDSAGLPVLLPPTTLVVIEGTVSEMETPAVMEGPLVTLSITEFTMLSPPSSVLVGLESSDVCPPFDGVSSWPPSVLGELFWPAGLLDGGGWKRVVPAKVVAGVDSTLVRSDVSGRSPLSELDP